MQAAKLKLSQFLQKKGFAGEWQVSPRHEAWEAGTEAAPGAQGLKLSGFAASLSLLASFLQPGFLRRQEPGPLAAPDSHLPVYCEREKAFILLVSS